MSDSSQGKFSKAADIAPDFSDLLGVPNLQTQLQELSHDQGRMIHLEKRDFMLGDAIGMAGLLVSLVSLFMQIREGNTYQGDSKSEVQERLITKLTEESSLPPDVRERLIVRLIDEFYSDDENHSQ